MSNSQNQGILARFLCWLQKSSAKKKLKAVRPKLNEVVHRTSSKKTIYRNKEVNRICERKLHPQIRLREISQKSEARCKRKSICIFGSKSFKELKSDGLSESVLVSPQFLRNSCSTKLQSPFLDISQENPETDNQNKLTVKQVKRDFQLEKFNLLGSLNSKNIFMTKTGYTSVGVSSKKQSKVAEDLEDHSQLRFLGEKITSPMVALDKRLPKKTTSKNSKKSEKAKGKNGKRQPKKYGKLAFTQNGLPNKSKSVLKIVNEKSPIQTSAVKKTLTSKFNNSQDPTNETKSDPKEDVGNSRVIIEDQDEYSSNSSSDGISSVDDCGSISNGERKESVSEIGSNYSPDITKACEKIDSMPLYIPNNPAGRNFQIIKETVTKLTKKPDNFFSLRDAALSMSQVKSRSGSAMNLWDDQVNSSLTNSELILKVNDSRSDFWTDLGLMRIENQTVKNKAVLSRLKMMI